MIKSIWYFTKIAFLILIAVVILLFIIFNNEKIILNLYPLSYKLELRLFVLVTLCLIVGFTLGLIVSAKDILKTNINTIREVRELKKELNEAEKQSQTKEKGSK